MTCQRQQQFIPGNSATIINHANQTLAALLQGNLDRLRTRIQTVFNQLLNHRRRSLNDFAGSDLVDQEIW